MGVSVYELFDEAIQKSQVWLNELRDELEWEQPNRVLATLRAALHTLRDRLPPAEAAHLGAQLPLLVRGLYYDGWRPAGEPRKVRHRDPFLARVEHEMREDIAGRRDSPRQRVGGASEKPIPPALG